MDTFNKNIENLSKLLDEETAKFLNVDIKNQLLKKLLVSSVKEQKGGDLFGIFFKFKSIITTLNGDVFTHNLADGLAEKIAQKGFVVIAGDFVYEKKGEEIIKESTTLNEIKEKLEDSNSKLCEILASLTTYAIFLLINEDSASLIESIFFHKEEFEDNEGSIAIGFTDKTDKFIENRCKHLKKEEISSQTYFLCESDDFRKCFLMKDNCFFTKDLKLSATPLEQHINKKYSHMILVNKHNNLHEIIYEVMKI